jgi:hypothetical protein
VMSPLFETTPKDIESLSDVQLTQLLHKLLLLEANKIDLPKHHVSVSLSITISDGGEDGRIEWEEGPDPAESGWLQDRLTLYQVKATDMTPGKCETEVQYKNKKTGKLLLKPRVEDVVKKNGAYVLFYGRSCEHTMNARRVNSIRKGIATVSGFKRKAAKLNIKVYGSEKISTWANEYISAVVFVLGCLGRNMPASMQTESPRV